MTRSAPAYPRAIAVALAGLTAAAAVACTPPPPVPALAPSDRTGTPFDDALSSARARMGRRDWSGAAADLQRARAAAHSPKELGKVTYWAATLAAYRDEMGRCLGLLQENLERSQRDGEPSEFWVHNQLTWVRWAIGNGPGALDEVEAADALLDRSTEPREQVEQLRLHELWDRAYILLDLADQAEEPERGRLREKAAQAQRSFEALAFRTSNVDGLHVLRAVFASKRGDAAAVRGAMKEAHVESTDDMQDVFALAVALADVGDPGAAAVLFTRVEQSDTPYLMHALLQRRSIEWRREHGQRP